MQSPELEAAAVARASTVDPEVEPGMAPAPLLASQLEEYLLLSLDILVLMVPAAVVAEDKPEVTMDLVVMERAVAPAPVLAPPSLPIMEERMQMQVLRVVEVAKEAGKMVGAAVAAGADPEMLKQTLKLPFRYMDECFKLSQSFMLCFLSLLLTRRICFLSCTLVFFFFF